MFERNARCLQSRTESMEVKELWSKIPMIVNQCSERRFLRIRGYRNRDETKIHVMPSEVAFLSEYACSIISLGVGRDVAVETKMKKDMPLCSFYGADPIREPNQEMFEQSEYRFFVFSYSKFVMSSSFTEVLLDSKDLPLEPVHVISIAHEERRNSSYESDTLTSCCPPHMVYVAVIIYAVLASTTTRGDASNMFERNARCLQSRTESMEVKELWSKIPMIVNQCSERRFLRIRGYRNRDETKIHVMPSEVAFLSEYACSIISLGVGRDVAVETKMKKDMPLCSFYGADPIREPNQEMFEQVGEFYHIAVGGRNGTSQAMVLEPDTGDYRVRRVRHIDIATFLRSFIQKQIIDQLMIDIEWDEYDVLPFLLKTGDIENTNVVICQMNIEIHCPDFAQKLKFFDFFYENLEEARYMPLVTDTKLGHIRLYMLNYKHPECRRRYIERE